MAIRGQGSRGAGRAASVGAMVPGAGDGVNADVTALKAGGGWRTTDRAWRSCEQGLTPSADGTMIHYQLHQ